jgi:hypothetical protein
VLAQGFDFDGRRVPLLGPEGIFKPAILPVDSAQHHQGPFSDRLRTGCSGIGRGVENAPT